MAAGASTLLRHGLWALLAWGALGSENMQCAGGHVTVATDDGNVVAEVIGSAEVLSSNVLVAGLNAGGSLGGRSYFGTRCSEAKAYANSDYLELPLAGAALSWEADVSKAGCGCNVAFYLASMRQNPHEGRCGDYYCDANSVCGVACAEVDLMEANRFAFHTTLHTASDPYGAASGYGGGAPPGPGPNASGWSGPRDFGSADYGPGAGHCIDTTLAFRVKVRFPLGPDGVLTRLAVTLSQGTGSGDVDDWGAPASGCAIHFDAGVGYAGLAEVTAALEAGMTPVLSYWSVPGAADGMGWMDGAGLDGAGPCAAYTDADCGPHAGLTAFTVSAACVGSDGFACEETGKRSALTTAEATGAEIALVAMGNARGARAGAAASIALNWRSALCVTSDPVCDTVRALRVLCGCAPHRSGAHGGLRGSCLPALVVRGRGQLPADARPLLRPRRRRPAPPRARVAAARGQGLGSAGAGAGAAIWAARPLPAILGRLGGVAGVARERPGGGPPRGPGPPGAGAAGRGGAGRGLGRGRLRKRLRKRAAGSAMVRGRGEPGGRLLWRRPGAAAGDGAAPRVARRRRLGLRVDDEV